MPLKITVWHDVSKVHLGKLGRNGARKITRKTLWEVKQLSAAKCLFTFSNQGRGGREWGGEWPSSIIEAEKESKHTSLIKHALFHRMYVLTEEFRADRKHFSLLLSEWWKGCSHWENKNGKWDRCELVSKPPHQPAQTPMGYRHTSGRNCQWDWYSARMNKKWIVLLRCKHKVTWAIMHLLRFALIPPPLPTVDLFTLYFMCFCHLQINMICKSIDSSMLSLNSWSTGVPSWFTR